MKSDWKTTPNGMRLKNLVTPSLLRRRYTIYVTMSVVCTQYEQL